MRAINTKNEKLIGCKIAVASWFWTKMVGLLNRKNLHVGEGLLIKNCNNIHSIGMKFNFDAVYLDKKNTVVHFEEDIPSGRICKPVLKAAHVLELPSGTVKLTDIEIGNEIKFEDIVIERALDRSNT